MEQPDAGPADDLVRELRTALPGSLDGRIGIEITAAGPDRVEGTMPVEGNRQPYGVLHGGASCALAETLASVGAAVAAWPERLAYGIELNATHHRSAREGRVHGVAVPLHHGRTVSTWSVEIVDDEGRRVCTARVTCVLRQR